MQLNSGALAALGTAVAWTATSIAFEYAGKRIGSLALNLLRLVAAFVFLGVYGLVVRGLFLPTDAPASAWLWLGASGLVGFVIGDLALFQAYIDIGARLSLLIYATAPIFTAFLGFVVFGEGMSALGAFGMAATLAAIILVVSGKKGGTDERHDPSRRARGVLLALIGTLGQAGGLILGKLGAGSIGSGAASSAPTATAATATAVMDPFAGTQARVSAGIVGFLVVVLVSGSWRGFGSALRDRKALASLTVGAFFGPFLGVSLSLLSVQMGNTGVASAIMSITPVLIIAPSVLIFKEKVGLREILGAVIAVTGVCLLSLA